MTTAEPSSAVSSFLGRILDSGRQSVGTCFQVNDGTLVTAYHVLASVGADRQGASVQFESMDHTDSGYATVERVDPEHDLAVLHAEKFLKASIPHLAPSDAQKPGISFHMVGFAQLPEAYGFRHYDYTATTGIWEGVSQADEGIMLGRGRAEGAALGMSGSPILRIPDNAVIGVLSQRYNSNDGWSRGTIWASRIEDLVPLIRDLSEIPFERPAPVPSAAESSWLAETILDRGRLSSDTCFVLSEAWSDPWEQGTTALGAGDVLVIVAPSGVGATAFAEHLLARTLPESSLLARLDPGEWDKPAAFVLPRRSRRAYVLDLPDPDHDRPSGDFVSDLGLLASWYREMMSRLVITVEERLWRGRDANPVTHVRVIRLDTSPDPRELVARYIEVQEPALLPVAQSETVSQHLLGMNAVQALQAVERIRSVKESLRPDQSINDPDLTDKLRELAADKLDDHHEELDRLFADVRQGVQPIDLSRSRRTEEIHPLSLHDRCMLMALACQGRTQLTRLEKDTQQLMGALGGGASDITPHETLAGPGLRGRVNNIKADIGQNEIVTLKRPSFGDAVVRYVWDYYTPVREPFTSWLIGLAAEDGSRAKEIAGLISALIRRHQDVEFIKNDLVKIMRDHYDLLAVVLYEGVLDPHMQRRCERLLYDWATRTDLQPVVIDVCARLLSTPNLALERRNSALTRLRRAADTARAASVTPREILNVFRSLTEDERLRLWFLSIARKWFVADVSSTSARIAFTAMINTLDEEIPWLLTEEAQGPDIDRMLGEYLADLRTADFSSDAVVSLVEKVSGDDNLYSRTIDRLTSVAAAHGAIRPVFELASRLSDAGRENGRHPLRDIEARLRVVPIELNVHDDRPSA